MDEVHHPIRGRKPGAEDMLQNYSPARKAVAVSSNDKANVRCSCLYDLPAGHLLVGGENVNHVLLTCFK